MKEFEAIKARAAKAAEARRNYLAECGGESIMLAFVAEQPSYDVYKLVAAVEAALATAGVLIEENQDASTLQSWGLMTAAQKVQRSISEALA